MSPEQAAGQLDRLGPASDVYGLGATLYHLLTGRAPFQDRDVATVLDRVRRGEFPPPREVNPRVPRPLEAIALKAMALRPEDRYAYAARPWPAISNAGWPTSRSRPTGTPRRPAWPAGCAGTGPGPSPVRRPCC